MALKLPGQCGQLAKAAVDALSDAEKRDREAVFRAFGKGIEDYIELLLAQLVIVIPPTPALGSYVAPPATALIPTAPGPAPVPLPPGSFK